MQVSDNESDESIQEYMTQLMNRVGGAGSSSDETPPSYLDASPDPEPEALSESIQPEPENQTPLRPEEYVPKSKQPEIDVNAIRSVANESARTAIQKHSHKSRKRDVTNSLYGAICFFLAGTSLSFWWEYGNVTRFGAIGCFIVGLLWIARPFVVNSDRFQNFKQSLKDRPAKAKKKKTRAGKTKKAKTTKPEN